MDDLALQEALKRLDYDNILNKMTANLATQRDFDFIRKCWYPTEEEQRQKELDSKLMEVELRGVRYSPFE